MGFGKSEARILLLDYNFPVGIYRSIDAKLVREKPRPSITDQPNVSNQEGAQKSGSDSSDSESESVKKTQEKSPADIDINSTEIENNSSEIDHDSSEIENVTS